MLQFISYLFFTIGLMAACYGIASAGVYITEKIQKANKQRQERYDRLIAAIDRIQAEIRNQTTQR